MRPLFVTVTPNPSLDRSVELEHLHRGGVHRATAVRVDPGGKGVNVARALAAAGHRTVALLPTGSAPGERLAALLEPTEVTTVTVPIAGATRVNITLAEPGGVTTKINEPGPVLTPDETEALAARAQTLCAKASWLVGCGSLPGGVGEDFLARLVRRCRRPGLRIAIDTSGAPLRHTVAAAPDLVKPNHAELAELVGRPLGSLGDVLVAARELRARGIGAVLVSLGAGGALLVDRSGEYHARTPPITVRSTVGAGDSTLAGFLAAGGAGPDALRQAVAHGAAACRLPGSAAPGPSDIRIDDVELAPTPDVTLALTGDAA
ncbi:1-phosphofructokinase [Pseudonocardia autotrophica]|uniref:1-phosphofructokinase n=2 Tax=Pseudonocardia TaxID=1847 RepID=A0A1Y2MYF1_PSEAH|nr:Tagatose-6-phosphate kinase [Pseudonocardia autotrophica]TDN74443.1 1-phosphofructokinase [Pseudonocardia autotrophica]BBG05210.1 1-phosphofructokinase [Pseudonocardia autotrophica]GEC25782.1 1-phosphofructokinase [Pseudonocardia saturnea]